MNLDLQLMSLGNRQWSLLNHDGKNLVKNIRSGHGRKLCVRIISRSNLDDIRTDEVEAIKPTDDGAQFTG
jgi:hypothetical protein